MGIAPRKCKNPAERDAALEHSRDVGLPEVVADKEKRLVGKLRHRVGKTVAEVEARRMTASTEAQKRISRLATMGGGERDYGEIEAVDQDGQERSRFLAELVAKDNGGLGEGGSAPWRIPLNAGKHEVWPYSRYVDLKGQTGQKNKKAGFAAGPGA